ncbi:MAG: hypothetical protein LBS53_05685 [Synergistaceae bacterium]|jgi:hypothetical protein|nr:hypothetical protein [Synergistaceae bacterium]
MDLFQNPFCRINARAHHNRGKLIELADMQGLVGDTDDASLALANLTNPRKRLAAEVAWLPGVSASQTDSLLQTLKTSPQSLLESKNIPPDGMARVNLLAAGMLRMNGASCSMSFIASWILEMAYAFESADPETLMMMINEDRIVSGFPEVTNMSAVREEINERRRYLRSVVMSVLNGMAAFKRLQTITAVIEYSTDGGKQQAPSVIFDMVDMYEVETKAAITGYERRIQLLISQLRNSVAQNHGDSDAINIIDALAADFVEWKYIAWPVHICAKIRGLKSARDALKNMLSELTSYLYGYNRQDFVERLSCKLKAAPEGWETEETAGKDREGNAVRTEPQTEQRQSSVTPPADAQPELSAEDIVFDMNVDIISRERVSVSSEWIEWRGVRWSMRSITRLRWGRIPEEMADVHGTASYRVFWGDDTGCAFLDFINSQAYEEFVRSLWKTVGLNLFYKILAWLKNGRNYRFGSVMANDFGIELERHKSAGSKKVFCVWDDIVIMDEPGVFCIGKKNNNDLWTDFKYLEDDNINLLENAVRIRARRGGDKLSSLLPA